MQHRSRWFQPLVILLALLLLAGCTPTSSSGKESGGVQYRDVTRDLGIKFTHLKPTFDPKVENIMTWLNSVGASVAAVDYNGSGCQSLYVTNSGEGSKNAFYRNNCNGTFTEVAAELGLADLNQDGVSVSSAWGDYNNSGCPSLYLLKWGHSALFRNNCDGTFTNVTKEAGVGYVGNPVKAVWFDFNRDSCLDLYVGTYFRPETDLWHLSDTRIMHNDFERAKNGGHNLLYQGDCQGMFTEVGASLGVDDSGWTLATGASDLNGDGWPDLYNANDFGPDSLYINQEGKRFVRMTQTNGVGDDTHKGMNIDSADLFNDGHPALYVSNISKPRYILEGNTVWLLGADGKWTNVAPDRGLQNCGFSWGARFFDANNDSRLDVVVTNGFVSGTKTDYWYELGTLATTPGQVVEDAANWPPIGKKSLSGDEHKCLFIQQADGKFKDVAVPAGLTSTATGRGVAVVDLFNRGQLDLVLANQGAPLQVYRNESTPNNWLTLRLIGRAPSNRDALGARLLLTTGQVQQSREAISDSSHGAQGDARIHFGLGNADKIDRLEIRWPSGRTQVLTEIAINQILTLEEPDNPVPATNP
ncbi:MAG TPA: CRTAC1 family protein [Symbiobacteriaceae bacterium]|nr:CRTAC1 family protein [Symbiobacteriaceae bacterium]